MMEVSNLKWDNSKIVKEYLKCTRDHLLNPRNDDLIIDKQNLEDILFFNLLKLPIIGGSIQSLKRNLNYDKFFLKEETTSFQKELVNNYIVSSLNCPFIITDLSNSYNNQNVITDTFKFLEKLNPKLFELLNKTISNKYMMLYQNKKDKNYAGTTYSLKDKSYIEVLVNCNNPFLTLNHELVHAFINAETKRRFDKENNIVLYREVGSILIEMYANEYLYLNNLISYEEYVSNFNDVYLSNVYNEIEIISLLFKIASDDNINTNHKSIRHYIDSEAKIDPNYDDIKIKELTELPLKHHLIYLYSCMIALGIYNNCEYDGMKDGLNIAINIMKNVNETNEKELFDKYNIKPFEALDNYVKKNNLLIKKKNI